MKTTAKEKKLLRDYLAENPARGMDVITGFTQQVREAVKEQAAKKRR